MNAKMFMIVSLIFTFTAAATAQCGSHHTQVKSAQKHRKNLVEVASSVDDFATLVTAVKVAGLAETLQGEGPFTVFAPTNAAFAKLPEGTLKSLLKPEAQDQLTKILTYHVVAGSFSASDLITAIQASGGEFTLKTVSGDMLEARLSNGSVILQDENGGITAVTKTDVSASNGVIHVLDSVVLPK